VNAAIPPVALDGPILTIRKFSKDPYQVSDLIGFGTLTNESAAFIQACVLARANILVSGGTGTGKTTLLNVCSGFIPIDERHRGPSRMRQSCSSIRSMSAVSRLVRQTSTAKAGSPSASWSSNSLRMRPDRIVGWRVPWW